VECGPPRSVPPPEVFFPQKIPPLFYASFGGGGGHYRVTNSLELRNILEKTAFFHLFCLSFNIFSK